LIKGIITSMKLILIRHGQSVANAKKEVQGREEGKLTEAGIKQAKEAGKYLKENFKIDMVFCSPLKRCVETLENILSQYPIEGEILLSKLLEERDFGEYSGTPENMIDWEEINADNQINLEMGIESLGDLKKRAVLFLEDLKMENPEKTVLVVSHNEILKEMISKLTDSKREAKIDNAKPMVFDYEIEEVF